jgi:hypothetical protein
MDEQFPPNSHRAKDPARDEKIVEQVTSGKARGKKSSLGKRFTRTFIGGDAKTAAGYVVATVVIPTMQELLAEGASTLIERMIYGDRRGRRGVNRGGPLGQVTPTPYHTMSQASRPAPGTTTVVSNTARARHDFTEIVISSRSAADEVLDQMYNLLERYDEVSVADLYSLTGIRSSHTDNKWGWNSLRGASVGRIRGGGGYVLELPEPIELQ